MWTLLHHNVAVDVGALHDARVHALALIEHLLAVHERWLWNLLTIGSHCFTPLFVLMIDEVKERREFIISNL